MTGSPQGAPAEPTPPAVSAEETPKAPAALDDSLLEQFIGQLAGQEAEVGNTSGARKLLRGWGLEKPKS